jgi:hypothetical protein
LKQRKDMMRWCYPVASRCNLIRLASWSSELLPEVRMYMSHGYSHCTRYADYISVMSRTCSC